MDDIQLMFVAGAAIFIFGIISGYSPTITIKRRN